MLERAEARCDNSTLLPRNERFYASSQLADDHDPVVRRERDPSRRRPLACWLRYGLLERCRRTVELRAFRRVRNLLARVAKARSEVRAPCVTLCRIDDPIVDVDAQHLQVRQIARQRKKLGRLHHVISLLVVRCSGPWPP